MKKGIAISFVLVLFMVSFASAGFFDNVWWVITGKPVTGEPITLSPESFESERSIAVTGVNAVNGTNESCYDSDGGLNYGVLGFVSGWFSNYNGSGNYNYADYCVSPTMIVENYCYGEIPMTQIYSCPGACEAGECVEETQTHRVCSGTSCIEVQGAGVDQCTNNGQCINQTNQTETHNICSGTSCIEVQGAGTDECVHSGQCVNQTETHKVCSGNNCVSIQGAGVDQCTSYLQCVSGNQTNQTETHNICSGSLCVSVPGIGTDQCTHDGHCVNQTQNETHNICSGTSCIEVQGAGVDQCTNNGQCINQTQNITCVDSDGGLNYYEGGYVEYYTLLGIARQDDECTGDLLEEWYCNSLNEPLFSNFDCPGGCSNGECLFGGNDTLCGDANSDGGINILDITYMVAYLYKGGNAPQSMYAANVNGDSFVNILDITYLINYLYKQGDDLACAEINIENQTQQTDSQATGGMTPSNIEAQLERAQEEYDNQFNPGFFTRVLRFFGIGGNDIGGTGDEPVNKPQGKCYKKTCTYSNCMNYENPDGTFSSYSSVKRGRTCPPDFNPYIPTDVICDFLTCGTCRPYVCDVYGGSSGTARR